MEKGEKLKEEPEKREKSLVKVLDIRREGGNTVVIAWMDPYGSFFFILPCEELTGMDEERFRRRLREEAEAFLKTRHLKEIMVEV